jgi:uncharacterized alpha-E superfamily protein
MLSRVAESVYWMGRYLERSEHLARILLVTEDLSTEILGFNERLAQTEWENLSAMFPGSLVKPVVSRRRHGPRLAHESSFFLDRDNPNSIFCCLRAARDNARSIREAITTEVFTSLNETYLEVENYSRSRLTNLSRITNALSSVEKGILSIIGAIDYTLSRDQSWLFIKLAESLERVFRAALVLRVQVPRLCDVQPGEVLPLYDTRWRGLLRNFSSLENYRQSHGAIIQPERVIKYLLCDPYLPRSLQCGVLAVKIYLERISGSEELSLPLKIIGRLHAQLCYEDDRIIGQDNLSEFLESFVHEIAACHEAISRKYFLN